MDRTVKVLIFVALFSLVAGIFFVEQNTEKKVAVVESVSVKTTTKERKSDPIENALVGAMIAGEDGALIGAIGTDTHKRIVEVVESCVLTVRVEGKIIRFFFPGVYAVNCNDLKKGSEILLRNGTYRDTQGEVQK